MEYASWGQGIKKIGYFDKLIVGKIDWILIMEEMLGFWKTHDGEIMKLGLIGMMFRENQDMIMLWKGCMQGFELRRNIWNVFI